MSRFKEPVGYINTIEGPVHIYMVDNKNDRVFLGKGGKNIRAVSLHEGYHGQLYFIHRNEKYYLTDIIPLKENHNEYKTTFYGTPE